MAVRTFNPSGSADNWSTASAWGGSIPADGDSFVISAGKTCYMDVDQSAMAIGMVAGTVNGVLAGPNGAGTGILKMDGVAGHDITVGAGGAIIHGTPAAPAAASSVFKISLGAASEIYLSGNDRTFQMWPVQKTFKWVKLASDASSGSSAIVVDQTNAILQADGWAVGDYLCVVRQTTTGTQQQQLFTIASWGGGSTINLSGTLAASTLAGCHVVNHSSSGMILTARTSGSEAALYCNYACPVLDFAGNVVNTACVSNATNAGGYGIAYFSNSLGRGNIQGTFHGLTYGSHYCRGLNYPSGAITGCVNGVSRLSRAVLNALIAGCNAATANFCADIYLPSSAIVHGCCYGLNGVMGKSFFNGRIGGGLNAFLACDLEIGVSATVGGTSALWANTNGDVDASDAGSVVGQGAMLQSTVPVYGYKARVAHPNTKPAVAMYNYASSVGNPQYGRHWFWTGGGYTQPTTDGGFAALGYASVEKMVFEYSANLNFIDLPLELTAGQPFSMTIDVQLGSGSYTFVEPPSVTIVDPALPFEDAGAVLAAAARSTGGGIDVSSSSIQRLYISYVPPVTASFPYGAKKPAVLRIKGRGGNSSGTGTDYMLFAYSSSLSVVADVQSLGGSSAALTKLISDADLAFKPSLDIGVGAWAGTTGLDALKAAWAQGCGRWRLVIGPPHFLELYAPDNATIVKRFSIDSIDLPTERV